MTNLGHEVVIFSRSIEHGTPNKIIHWDGETLGNWKEALEGCDAVINMAGRSVNCRYTKKNRAQMINSRVRSTRILGTAIQQCREPPKVWLNSSTATIYKHRFSQPNDEYTGLIGAHPDAKDIYSIEVAEAWENEFNSISTGATRKLILRTAIVFGNQSGGAYDVLRKLTRIGLGGTMGSGKQWVSWIHETDFCNSILHLIQNQTSEGIYNLSAPNPLPNKEMMRTLRHIHRSPFGLPATKWMLEIGAFFLRTETELIIKSRYVVPMRLQEEGFEFEYSFFKDAIQSLENLAECRANRR